MVFPARLNLGSLRQMDVAYSRGYTYHHTHGYMMNVHGEHSTSSWARHARLIGNYPTNRLYFP